MNEETEKQILEELRKLNALAAKANKTNTVAMIVLGIVLALFVAAIPLLRHRLLSHVQSATQVADSWSQANALLGRGDTQKGKEMIERLLQKFPDYYYGHTLMGSVYQELGDLDAAEKSYARAVELFPDEDNEKTLAAIRRAIQNKKEFANQPAHATGKPAPGR